MKLISSFSTLLLLILCIPEVPGQSPRLSFDNVAQETGLFVLTREPLFSFGDFDSDGDLLCVGSGHSPKEDGHRGPHGHQDHGMTKRPTRMVLLGDVKAVRQDGAGL